MTVDSIPPARSRIVVHADNCDSETLAAVVMALSSRPTATETVPVIAAWQLAAFHEARSDLRIVSPQQLEIRGNKQW